MDVSGEPFCCF